MPGHYPNEYGFVVHWTIEDEYHSNLNQNTKIFIQENAFENAVAVTWLGSMW